MWVYMRPRIKRSMQLVSSATGMVPWNGIDEVGFLPAFFVIQRLFPAEVIAG